MCVEQQNKNCLITDIACPCDKRVDIEQEINNKYSQQDLVSSSGMKILLVKDTKGTNRPFYRYGGHIELIQFKEYYRMPRGHEHISLVFWSAFRDILFLKFS